MWESITRNTHTHSLNCKPMRCVAIGFWSSFTRRYTIPTHTLIQFFLHVIGSPVPLSFFFFFIFVSFSHSYYLCHALNSSCITLSFYPQEYLCVWTISSHVRFFSTLFRSFSLSLVYSIFGSSLLPFRFNSILTHKNYDDPQSILCVCVYVITTVILYNKSRQGQNKRNWTKKNRESTRIYTHTHTHTHLYE